MFTLRKTGGTSRKGGSTSSLSCMSVQDIPFIGWALSVALVLNVRRLSTHPISKQTATRRVRGKVAHGPRWPARAGA